MSVQPSDTPMTIRACDLPHGIMHTSADEREWFERVINSDIRQLYRRIRNLEKLDSDQPIGTSGMTIGELSLYIIRTNHERRKRRY